MAPYIIQAEGDGNEVAVESGKYRVIFDVISERGIGAASVTEGMDTFPPSVVLRFHLGGLEELHFIYDGVEIHISVSSNE